MKMKPCCQTKLTGCIHYEKWKRETIKKNKEEYREWAQSDNGKEVNKHVKINAHKANQLELIGNEKKIENMENTIRMISSKM